MRFDAVPTSTNHACDFSEGGYLTTLKHLDEVDLPNAGDGHYIDHARAPAYVDSARGRIAVMFASSTFTEDARAGPGRPDFPGKPGINALRHDLTHYIEKDVFDALRNAHYERGYAQEPKPQLSSASRVTSSSQMMMWRFASWVGVSSR